MSQWGITETTWCIGIKRVLDPQPNSIHNRSIPKSLKQKIAIITTLVSTVLIIGLDLACSTCRNKQVSASS